MSKFSHSYPTIAADDTLDRTVPKLVVDKPIPSREYFVPEAPLGEQVVREDRKGTREELQDATDPMSGEQRPAEITNLLPETVQKHGANDNWAFGGSTNGAVGVLEADVEAEPRVGYFKEGQELSPTHAVSLENAGDRQRLATASELGIPDSADVLNQQAKANRFF